MKYREIHFEEIGSTNDYLKDNYSSLDNFTIASADYQSHGKGRNSRVWKGNPKENLAFSILIKNKDLVTYGGLFSLSSSVGVSKIIEKYLPNKKIEIKWPNDVYINDKKVCGILLEGSLPNYLVIGIGININQKDFIGEYRKTPTSLYLESRVEFDIDELKKELFDELINNVSLTETKIKNQLDYFESHNYLKNKIVDFLYDKNRYQGKVVGVDNSFNLLIDIGEKVLSVSSGEIELIH